MESNRKMGQGSSWTVAPAEEEEEEITFVKVKFCTIKCDRLCTFGVVVDHKHT
jgi:hypothetical protein